MIVIMISQITVEEWEFCEKSKARNYKLEIIN